LSEVYRKRILREQEFFSSRKLGAMGSNLSALSGLLDPPWNNPVDELIDNRKSFILNEVGFYLRALGRLVEATQPMQAGLEIDLASKDWINASVQAGNLSELYLILGNVKGALAYAEQSVDFVDRSDNMFLQRGARSTLANALHQKGFFLESETVFREAENIQKNAESDLQLLYSAEGFRYCDLLLSQGDYAEVERRASQTIEIAKKNNWLWDIALDNLSLGRAHLLHAQHEPDHSYAESLTYLNRGVDGLRQAGHQYLLPLGLLARAEYYRITGVLDKAQRDLDEAFAIASRGGMRLYLADCHLEFARLALARGEKEKAREHWGIARDSIEEMGYHRRDKEVEELEKQLAP